MEKSVGKDVNVHEGDGGPFFPLKFTFAPGSIRFDGTTVPDNVTENHIFSGASVRDVFALGAMIGMNANPELLEHVTKGCILDGSAFDRMADKAYAQADAMLAARSK